MILSSIVRYADDTAGLEKLLRLFQGFCTIASGFASAGDLETVVKLRSQFALGRRYFRFLKWHPCWSSALQIFGKDQSALITLLEVGKWSFLGMYFFLEMFTIGNAMGVTNSEWGPKVQREANKCWFYALILSIVLGLWEIIFNQSRQQTSKTANHANGTADGSSKETTKPEDKSEKKPSSPDKKSASRVYTQLIIDSCDLSIPGAAVGWIPVGPVFVGTASTISSLLAGRQIWIRVQQRAVQP